MDEDQIAEWLHDGAVALCAGEKARAQELLLRVVQNDEQNIAGWLWLSGAVDDLDDQQIALENVLALDPDNPHALEGLEWIANHRRA